MLRHLDEDHFTTLTTDNTNHPGSRHSRLAQRWPQVDDKSTTPSRPFNDTHYGSNATTLPSKTNHDTQYSSRATLSDKHHFMTLTTANVTLIPMAYDIHDATTPSEYFMTLTLRRCQQ
ncbi:hypothetical protein BDR05DRAFT_963830 [Suillus weaverae]|nr:hypothetical protein BDR05DRAFT_963830 [Suillus weaverae]